MSTVIAPSYTNPKGGKKRHHGKNCHCDACNMHRMRPGSHDKKCKCRQCMMHKMKGGEPSNDEPSSDMGLYNLFREGDTDKSVSDINKGDMGLYDNRENTTGDMGLYDNRENTTGATEGGRKRKKSVKRRRSRKNKRRNTRRRR